MQKKCSSCCRHEALRKLENRNLGAEVGTGTEMGTEMSHSHGYTLTKGLR